MMTTELKILLLGTFFTVSMCCMACENNTNEMMSEIKHEQILRPSNVIYDIRTSNLYLSIQAATEEALKVNDFTFDRNKFATVLSSITGKSDYILESDWQTDHDAASASFYQMKYIENKNTIVQLNIDTLDIVVRDKQGYNIAEVAEDKIATNDNLLLSQSQRLLNALGATEHDSSKFNFNYLMESSSNVDLSEDDYLGSNKERVITTKKLAKKVFFKRSIDGIWVVGDFMVISYALDGTFRKLLGRWTPIDFKNSILRTDISEEMYKKKLHNYLAENFLLDVAAKTGVDASTCYVPTYGNGSKATLELKGCAEVFKSNGQDGGMYEIHVFDLN